MNLSSKGAAFIGAFEGFRAQCYDDAAGNCTIGYGHLVHLGPTTTADRTKWGTISKAEGLQLLERDAAKAALAVSDKIAVTLLQPEFDALVSLVYNCGPAASTATSARPSTASRASGCRSARRRRSRTGAAASRPRCSSTTTPAASPSPA